MNRLTHERNSGIKAGYWSPDKKEHLVQCLAAYENTGLTPEEIVDGKLLTGWIPVEERLPDERQEVLATDGRYVYLVEYDSDYGYGDLDGITAWMPLPEPYKPEN